VTTASVDEQVDPSFEERLNFCSESDVGRSREENEDNHGLLSPQDTGAGWLFIVADGMGGAAAGRTASEMAVNLIKEHYPQKIREHGPEHIFDALCGAIEEANLAIWRRAREDRECRGMGTTVTALVVHQGVAYTAHVGDSRIYRFRDGRLERMMRDHTRVQVLADQGIITPAEANHHPEGHVISRNLGGLPELEVDIPEDGPFVIREGDVFLLCSDGLHGLVEDEAIRQVLVAAPPRKAVPGLIQLANMMGGYDNITACVVCAGQGDGAWASFDQDTFDELLDELALDVNNDTEVFLAYDPSAMSPVDFATGELKAIHGGPVGSDTREVKRIRAPEDTPTLEGPEAPAPRASLQHTVSISSPFLNQEIKAVSPPAPTPAPQASAEPEPELAVDPDKGTSLLLLGLLVGGLLLVLVLGALVSYLLWGSSAEPVETGALLWHWVV
jgi:serine/threonine protein phosphatase PrpC